MLPHRRSENVPREAAPLEQSGKEEVVFPWPGWRTIIASPVLYAMIIPLVFLDLFLELYHRTAFPILGIPKVARKDYILIDRHRMAFLPIMVKIACAYCGYANGLLHYAVRIAGDTEWYFCPSKHQGFSGFRSPPHHHAFAEFGDAQGFRQRFLSGRPQSTNKESDE